MPIATPEVYAEMIARAKEHSFAFPAINCTSSETINAAIKGFADAGSDGIIQFSTGGAEFGSGLGVKDMVTGAVALAEFAHVVADKYDVTIALHTDHCPKDKLDTFVRPLIAISQERVNAGRNPLFQSHMWDGSAVPIDENLEIAQELLAAAQAAKIILEIEIGVVGGEEDGVENAINDKLYTTVEDFEKTVDALAPVTRASTCSPRRSATSTRLQAGQRQAQAVRPRRRPGRRVEEAGSAGRFQAVRPGLPRRFGLAEVGDRGVAELRRREDERRHRHPVRVHSSRRGPHVRELRRCAQGGRRGRQQEDLRSAQLPEEGRSVDDRPRHRACNDLKSAGRSVSAG